MTPALLMRPSTLPKSLWTLVEQRLDRRLVGHVDWVVFDFDRFAHSRNVSWSFA